MSSMQWITYSMAFPRRRKCFDPAIDWCHCECLTHKPVRLCYVSLLYLLPSSKVASQYGDADFITLTYFVSVPCSSPNTLILTQRMNFFLSQFHLLCLNSCLVSRNNISDACRASADRNNRLLHNIDPDRSGLRGLYVDESVETIPKMINCRT